MNRGERSSAKGSDDNIRRYRQKKGKLRLTASLIMLASALLILVIILVIFINFGFRIKTIDVAGASVYSNEEILSCAGIELNDNILFVSEKNIENTLKEKFPYIRSVYVEKDYPSRIVLNVREEYTTFYFELGGEFFLFNHAMKVIDRFDSEEALLSIRNAINAEMPLVKSCIVSQYMELADGCEYVGDFIRLLSENFPADSVSYIDLTDKYYINMTVSENIEIVIGDFSLLSQKLKACAQLLGENPSSLKGNIDISVYPDCYYDLDYVV